MVVFRRELFDRIVLIYNPANPRIPRTLAEGVRDDLCRRLPDLPVTLQPTRFAGHAHELAAAAAATGRPLIVAVSGDGVYNEVINGIMDVDGSSALSAVAAGGNAMITAAAPAGCRLSRPSSMVGPDIWIYCD